jgi:hypothetical protein
LGKDLNDVARPARRATTEKIKDFTEFTHQGKRTEQSLETGVICGICGS